MLSPPAKSLTSCRPRHKFALGLMVTVAAAGLTFSQCRWTPRVEKPELTVAAMGVTDSMIVRLGARVGIFRDEGLDIGIDDIKIATSGPESLDMLDRGDVDVAYSTYAPYFASVVNPDVDDVTVVAPTSSAQPHSCVIVANPSSGIESPQDLVGKRVGVTDEDSQSAAMLKVRLSEVGIDPNSIELVPSTFSEMVLNVQNETLDAAFLTDPYLSKAKVDYEAVEVFDMGTGRLDGIPTAGFGTKTAFKEENPNTTAAFRRAMVLATEYARKHSRELAREVAEVAGIHEDIALRGTRLRFETQIEETDLQLISDVMHDVGMVNSHIDAAEILARWPKSFSIGHNILPATLPTLLGAEQASRFIACRRVLRSQRRVRRTRTSRAPMRSGTV